MKSTNHLDFWIKQYCRKWKKGCRSTLFWNR